MTEPKNKLTARDLMTPDVVTVSAADSLMDAIAVMDRTGFHRLPVLRDGKPSGLLTEGDVRRALLANRRDRPAAELASPLPPLVSPETRLSGVLEALRTQDAVLVTNAAGGLAGIITYWDLLVVARPALMVKEVELILRRVVAVSYAAKYGPGWWQQVPADLRRQAEEEHRADEHADPTPEHMLGHTSFWALIEIFRRVRSDLGDDRFQQLHRVRQLRNKVAHLYVLTDADEQEISTLCPATGTWLVSLLPAGEPLFLPPSEF